MNDRVLIVIPARYGSTRFAGKPLAVISGLPMIVHVYLRASKVHSVDKVIVATDDYRIKAVVEEAGGTAVMTAVTHPTGTSRVAEAASRFTHGIIVNVQGDEPLVPVHSVDRLIEAMIEDRHLVMGTLAAPATSLEDLMRLDVVKVVCDQDGNALYFSRSPIPFPWCPASPAGAAAEASSKTKRPSPYLRHMGVYAFRRAFLKQFVRMKPGPLERSEGLEQLRALEAGCPVRVVITKSVSIGVDRPEDVKRVERAMRTRPTSRRTRN
jgi:3-deoxy-manno-octulosonate cytidylyltransferase (CMP-KDO synthetase)